MAKCHINLYDICHTLELGLTKLLISATAKLKELRVLEIVLMERAVNFT